MTRPNVYTIESGWWNFVRPIEAWNRSKYLSVKMAPSAGSNMANTPQRLPNFSSKLSPVSTTASFAALPSIREESLYRRIWGSSDGRIGYDKGWKKRRVVCFINATFSNVERMAEMTKTWVENTGGIQAQLHPPVSQTQRSPPRSFSPGFPARS